MNNLTPWQTQLMATLGPIIGLVAGYFAAWWGVDQATALGILTGAIAFVFSAYNLWITRKSAQVTSVANLPEVKTIELDRTKPETKDLAAATPNNVISS